MIKLFMISMMSLQGHAISNSHECKNSEEYENNNEIELSLKLMKNKYVPYEPVYAILELFNISSKETCVFEDWRKAYRIEAVGRDETFVLPAINSPSAVSRNKKKCVNIPAGGHLTTLLYRYSNSSSKTLKPGEKYRIQAIIDCCVMQEKSNEVEVEILDSDDSIKELEALGIYLYLLPYWRITKEDSYLRIKYYVENHKHSLYTYYIMNSILNNIERIIPLYTLDNDTMDYYRNTIKREMPWIEDFRGDFSNYF